MCHLLAGKTATLPIVAGVTITGRVYQSKKRIAASLKKLKLKVKKMNSSGSSLDE